MMECWTNQFESFADGHLSSLVSIKEWLDSSLTVWKLASRVGQVLLLPEDSYDGYLLSYWV